MDPELKKLLEEDLSLNRENNFILQKLYSAYKLGRITSIIKWVLVIGIAAGAFYFIEPMFDQLLGAYGVNSSDVKNMLMK